MPIHIYDKIKEMFYPSGPRQVYLEEKQGKQAIVRRALDWDGTIIPNLLATDIGRFFIKYEERGPGVAVEFFPTAGNRSVSIHCKEIRCAATVLSTELLSGINHHYLSYSINSELRMGMC